MTGLVIPATLENYEIPQHVLDQTREFVRERGEHGVEAVVVWIGEIVDERRGRILAAYAPEQVARRSVHGISVEVTQEGLTRLISQLPEGVFVLIRVHSHPSEAYHSDVDDENMLISHEKAISIVVPFFGRDPIRLEHCSINELRHGRGWVELDDAAIRERFRIIS